MKAVEILGLGWKDGCYITFHTMDGRDGIVHYVTMSEALIKYGGSFAHYLGKAFQHADANNAKLLFDTFGWLFKDYIERFVCVDHPGVFREVIPV